MRMTHCSGKTSPGEDGAQDQCVTNEEDEGVTNEDDDGVTNEEDDGVTNEEDEGVTNEQCWAKLLSKVTIISYRQ